LATQKKVSITGVCRQLGYSKQAYYKFIRRKEAKNYYEEIIRQKVLPIRYQMPRLGGRKLYYMLQNDFINQNIPIGRDRFFRLLRQNNLLVTRKKRFVKTTDSSHWMRKYPNLIKDQKPVKPEQVWVADITYVMTRQGTAYLHLITDAYSKKIMGYELSRDLLATRTLQALKTALKQRQYKSSIIHHSDRGLQYCSAAYVNSLKKNGLQISMTQDGSPYDNAIAERINGILKDEFSLDETFGDFDQLKRQAQQAIFLYNNSRPHMSCSMLTPTEMHAQNKLEVKAWHKKAPRTLESSWSFLPSLPHS